MKSILALLCLWGAAGIAAESTDLDLLVKFQDRASMKSFQTLGSESKVQTEDLHLLGWSQVKIPASQANIWNAERISAVPGVVYVQPNFKIRLLENYQVNDMSLRQQLMNSLLTPMQVILAGGNSAAGKKEAKTDNPAIPVATFSGNGSDPLYSKQWGMVDNKVRDSWATSNRGSEMIVAVIDTGVDYTHEDLIDNMWRNPGETGSDSRGRDRATNGVDDDGNGYVDDVVGWDFAKNDNKPYDLSVDPMQLLFGGGNPGHGTHCAGNVAARADNGKGIAGVAPKAKIMALRFLTEKGEGDTAGAMKSINYAIRMGVKVTSNSWGSEGDDPADAQANKALQDAIQASQDAGALFIAAAGNGHSGVGYDNDTDPKPGVPASYSHEGIISVAAIDNADAMGKFSNWGARTVDIAAPGVAVYSTTVESKYSDTVVNMPQLGMVATWDGTSMATPHVAGAAALYWSENPNKTWYEVKQAILGSAKPIASMRGKSVTGGKLNVESLMQF